MGIKGFDLQEPVVPVMIFRQEGQAVLKGLRLGKVLFLKGAPAVFHVLNGGFGAVLPEAVGQFLQMEHLYRLERLHGGSPAVTFLAAGVGVGGIPGVVGAAAVLKIVIVICGQVGVDSASLQQLRHGDIEGLQRAPAAVKEIIAPGMQFSACGHTGHTADITLIKLNSVAAQALEIGKMDKAPAVSGQKMTIQRIVHDHNCFHNQYPL